MSHDPQRQPTRWRTPALATHLLNARDNEHIEVHELRGFSTDDLHGAFQEIEAVSRGTRAK